MNHVLWRDGSGKLWEVSPCEKEDPAAENTFISVSFWPDPSADFAIQSEQVWDTQPSRYEPLRPEGQPLVDCLVRAQAAESPAERADWLMKAFFALQTAGFNPKEMQLDAQGTRLTSVLCVVE